MFDELTPFSWAEKRSFAFLAAAFGVNKSQKITFSYDKKPCLEEDCFLEVVMKMYNKDYSHCDKCFGNKPYTRVCGRKCYHCPYCLFQKYPCAGTIFHKTRIPLRKWFNLIVALSEKDISGYRIAVDYNLSLNGAYIMKDKILRQHFFSKILEYRQLINTCSLS